MGEIHKCIFQACRFVDFDAWKNNEINNFILNVMFL